MKNPVYEQIQASKVKTRLAHVVAREGREAKSIQRAAQAITPGCRQSGSDPRLAFQTDPVPSGSIPCCRYERAAYWWRRSRLIKEDPTCLQQN